MREHRLGDIIDDYCVKCKQIMNHAVVSMLNADPAKVRCRTCHSDHDYRHEQAPPPKVDLRKAALFQEVSQRPGIGGHENLRLGGVGEHTACGLAGVLAAGGPIRLVRHSRG